MPGPNSDVTVVDGSIDFSQGVNSVKVTTVQSERVPNGLARNEVAWLNNATVRDGAISPRWGWQPLGKIADGFGIYQGGRMYEPDNGLPYLVLSIGGHIIKCDPNDIGNIVDLSNQFHLFNPPNIDYAFFCQAEQFLVIQAGDGVTLPLFWDGTTLRRSIGITTLSAAPGTPGVNEIPAAYAMDYYMDRLWYAQGRRYSAGDIVGGKSGTNAFAFRDAVLNVTENPLVVGGDGFTVPTNAGNIRALAHNASIDAALGEGMLYIFTRKEIYSMKVPITRGEWLNSTTNTMPLQSVVQLVNGAVNDRSIVPVNGDLFFQSLEPGIRSLITAVRYFNQWGNIEISANEIRVLQFNDRNLLRFGSGIEFDNRMLQTALPTQTPLGVTHKGIIPLDFIPISSFGTSATPVWEGLYEGLDVLQLFTGDFGGRQRAFSAVISPLDHTYHLWEMDIGEKFENGDNRVTWVIESPAYTWDREFALKKLVSAEVWVDRLYGCVVFRMDYRPDGETCWHLWHEWKECSPRNSAEDANNPISYPLTQFGPSYRSTMTLPQPKAVCETQNARPSNIGYQFQVRLTVHGYCRVRGILLHAQWVERKLYDRMVS